MKLLVLLLVLTHLTACATTLQSRPSPGSQRSRRHLTMVDTSMVEPIKLERVVVRDPRPVNGTWLDVDAFRAEANDLARRAGFDVVGSADPLFSVEDSRQARFLISGIVKEMEVTWAEATAVVEWHILDVHERKVVFSTTQSGLMRAATPRLSAAVLDAFKGLLVESRFRTLVARRDSPPVAASSALVGQVTSRCASPIGSKLPAGLEELFKATVIIRAGQAMGSGVVVSEDGHVLTAAHVVSGLSKAHVQFKNGLKLEGDVVAVDARQDVALIRIPGAGHLCVAASPDRAAVGTELFTVGSPLAEELSFSVSRGIVSAYRTFDGSDFLQMDASLNKGNSGGPVFDASGRLLAIVSWKVVGSSAEGLGFGVPLDVALARVGLDLGGQASSVIPVPVPVPTAAPAAPVGPDVEITVEPGTALNLGPRLAPLLQRPVAIHLKKGTVIEGTLVEVNLMLLVVQPRGRPRKGILLDDIASIKGWSAAPGTAPPSGAP